MTVISGFMTLMLSYIRDFLLPVQVPTNNNKTFMLTLGYILNRIKFYLIAFPTSTSILLSSYYLFCRMYRTRNFIELKCEVARSTAASLSLRNNMGNGVEQKPLASKDVSHFPWSLSYSFPMYDLFVLLLQCPLHRKSHLPLPPPLLPLSSLLLLPPLPPPHLPDLPLFSPVPV